MDYSGYKLELCELASDMILCKHLLPYEKLKLNLIIILNDCALSAIIDGWYDPFYGRDVHVCPL